ncbi:MAG: type II toxin-antitoxin system HicA family toxin [Nitrospirae bacterium]|nr:type II toxin-antitoxin system HicA family toxin [Nitrospirota bacterium]
MRRLPDLARDLPESVSRSIGFATIRREAGHKYFRHPDGRASVVAPPKNGEHMARGLLRAILKSPEQERRK